jgi:hypothetical protein
VDKNESFKKLNIPYKIFIEDKKTFLNVVGKEYWFVKPEYAVLS